MGHSVVKNLGFFILYNYSLTDSHHRKSCSIFISHSVAKNVAFLPRDALVHSAVMRLLSSVCPSVCLSVCLSVCNDQVP